MTLPITDGRIEVYTPTNRTHSPDLVIRPPDLQSVTVTQEVQDASGKAKIAIDSHDGRYAGEISTGDKLEFVVSIGGSGSGSGTSYGSGTYGDGTYGARTGLERRWTGLASIPRYSFEGVGQRSLTVDAQPFAFGVMGSLGRKVDNAFRQRPVGEIARTIITTEADELDPSGIDTFPETEIDIEFDGTPLLSAMTTLAETADAILTARGETVIMTPTSGIPIQWTATADDFGTWSVDPVDDELWNQVRIEGGTDNDEGDMQTTQTGYTTVTEDSPLTTQLTLPKSRIDQVDLWVAADREGESITVRIQEDDGGAPTDVTDSTKDLVNKTLSSDFLDVDGYTPFLLKHTELPAPNPWLIIQTDEDAGQSIGVDSNGTPTYIAYYPYPIITQQSNRDSIKEYRRREHRITKDNITTATAAATLAETTLRHHSAPRDQFEGNAQSPRAHRLQPADAIKLDFEKETAVGTYLVTTRTDQYAPSDSTRNLLTTDLRLQEVGSF